VKQFENQIFYPTYQIDYIGFTCDQKIINFCQYVQFKYDARALIISGDQNLIGAAISKDINTIWNTRYGGKVEDYINSDGLIK
jgi:hypothetical protein